MTSINLLLTLVLSRLALCLAGEATLVGSAESSLLTRVSNITILLGDGLRGVGHLVSDLVGNLVEISNAVRGALSRGRVLHVVIGQALSLRSNTTLRSLTKSTMFAGVREVRLLLGDGLRVRGHLRHNVLGFLLEVCGAVGGTLADRVGRSSRLGILSSTFVAGCEALGVRCNRVGGRLALANSASFARLEVGSVLVDN